MTSDESDQDEEFATRAIHAGQPPDPSTGAVMTPIYASSTFAQTAPGEHQGYEYSRTANPTRDALEANIASLEGATYGRAFASGMAAIDTVVNILEPDSRIVAGEDVYGGTYRLFTSVWGDYDLQFEFVDMTDPEAVGTAVGPETDMVWLESPTNPMLQVVDIEAIAELTDEVEALCVVDNTFATPYLQRPLEYGADIVVHSLTKYLGGHSDVVAGAVATDDPALDEALAFYQNSVGAVPDPWTAFLVLRGTKTLPVRMERHGATAAALADWLMDHPRVDRVHYPGLGTHPQHDLATEQMDGYGGMISFELDGGLQAARHVVSATEIWTLAESLGGVESLIEHPASMTHASMPAERRAVAGVTDSLIRLSVGLESPTDLRSDLEQALAAGGGNDAADRADTAEGDR